jgi:hypothetical protein
MLLQRVDHPLLMAIRGWVVLRGGLCRCSCPPVTRMLSIKQTSLKRLATALCYFERLRHLLVLALTEIAAASGTRHGSTCTSKLRVLRV